MSETNALPGRHPANGTVKPANNNPAALAAMGDKGSMDAPPSKANIK